MGALNLVTNTPTCNIPLDDLKKINAEPRVQDLLLALRLGFEKPRDVRELIRRNFSELQTYGVLPHLTAKPPKGSAGGRPTKCYYLNEHQALLVCMFSRAANAADVRRALVMVFAKYRKELLDTRIVRDNEVSAEFFADRLPRAALDAVTQALAWRVMNRTNPRSAQDINWDRRAMIACQERALELQVF